MQDSEVSSTLAVTQFLSFSLKKDGEPEEEEEKPAESAEEEQEEAKEAGSF